jgi:ParB/RepB/Spo0J family partition protein
MKTKTPAKKTAKPAAKKPAPTIRKIVPATENVQSIDTKLVMVSKLNTRQPKAADVAELIESIRAGGQISPAIVRPAAKKPGHYELAAGARRMIACTALKIPLQAIVRDIPDGEFEDMILTDNLQRVDPDPMQEAVLVERRLAAGVPATEIAARYGKSEMWLKRRMKLIGLTPDARAAWLPDGAFSHFTVEMMEFIGTLPAKDQDHLADNAWDMREFGTLADLLRSYRNQAKDLEKVTWLNDPASFIEGCGPGCATNSAESLFPDPNHACGQCTNGECFRKREQKFADSKLAAALHDSPVADFIFFKSKSHANEITYKGAVLKVMPAYTFRDHYTLVKKAAPGTKQAINLEDPLNPQLCWLKPKVDAKGKATAPASGKPKESREDRLTGKRLAHLNQQLHEHCEADKAPLPENTPILSIVAAFGLPHARNTCTGERDFKEAWESLDTPVCDMVSGLGYGSRKTAHRADILWQSVLTILKHRLAFRVNNDLLPKWKQAEMKRIADLTGFNHETAWQTICTTTVPIPKSWGPGLDPSGIRS